MQRLLAVLLVLIGLTGLVLGRLGETVWAPETSTTATVDLSDAGPAVVIDPGVLYVGGTEGELVIEGASDVSVITAGNGDLEAYLEDVRFTRITGASDWTTLSTEEIHPEGEDELSDPTSSDLWRTVDTGPSPYTLDIHEFWAAENNVPGGENNEQPYRALLIVTDGTEPGAEKISITWPVDAENEWVPFAYAGGAAIAVIGLVLLVVSLGGRRRDGERTAAVAAAPRSEDDGEARGDDDTDVLPATAAAGAGPAAAGTTGSAAAGEPGTDENGSPSAEDGTTDDAAIDRLFTTAPEQPREENVWSLGTGTDEDAASNRTTDDAPEDPARETPSDHADTAAPAPKDRTEQLDAVDDEEERR